MKEIEIQEGDLFAKLQNELDLAMKNFDITLFNPGSDNSVFCSIHSFLGTRNADHNCIGCNIDDILKFMRSVFSISKNLDSVENVYFLLIPVMNLVVERLDIINYMFENKVIDRSTFQSFQIIRKWTNFIKHPKAFMFCHHPKYAFENYEHLELYTNNNKVIDYEFVNKYFSNKNKDEILINELEGIPNILVLFPDIVQLTSRFSDQILNYLDILKSNARALRTISSKTTYLNFWEDYDYY